MDIAVNGVIYDLYRTGKCTGRNGFVLNPYDTCISFQAGVLLYALMMEIKGTATIEVGFGCGLSTLFMCQAHADLCRCGMHTAIDPHQRAQFKETGLMQVEEAQLKKHLTVVEEPSEVALPRLATEGCVYQLVFVDGWHTFDQVLVDFFFSDRMLAIGGYLVFDDIWLPSISKVVSFVVNNRHYRMRRYEDMRPVAERVEVLCQKARELIGDEAQDCADTTEHLCILQKVGHDNRDWDHFIPF